MKFKRISIMMVIAVLLISTQGFAMAELYPATQKEVNKEVMFMDQKIAFDVQPMEIDGITMVPLRATLEKMGYKVTWNEETKSVEMNKGPKWTSITIGKNAYFKNRMAPQELSLDPVIKDGRTLVPIEFFTEILDINVSCENMVITFTEEEPVIIIGYVKDIVKNEKGDLTFTVNDDLEIDDYMNSTVIHTIKDNTIFNTSLEEGKAVKVVVSRAMTLSLPPQTNGYLVY